MRPPRQSAFGFIEIRSHVPLALWTIKTKTENELLTKLDPSDNLSSMYRSRKQSIDWSFSLRLGDLFAIILSFPLAFWASLYIDAVPTPDTSRITVLNCLFFAGLVIYFFNRLGLYRWDVFLRKMPLLRRLPLALVVSELTYLLIRLFVAPKHNFTYLPFLLLYCAICFAFVLGMRLLIRFIDIRILKSVRVERIAFVGWSKRLGKVLRGLAREMRQFQTMEGFFANGSDPAQRPPADSGYSEIGTLENLEKYLESRLITMLVVDQSKVSPADLRMITDLCADAMVNLRMIPSAFDIWADRLSIRVVSGVPLMGINNLDVDFYGSRLLKRLVDIVGSLVGLALSAPVIAVLAVMIRRESPGPIFYRQTRLGLRGKPFEIIKLRSMRLDAEETKGAVWTVENDPRRLRIGTFMREWNLDELPQFWNVLHGEMSLVGPRPERPEFVSGFRDTVRFYNLRHTCKPGVTGWAAVHGLRGNTSLEDRLEYDLYYIENWSLALDFKIMLMTLAPPKNAY